MTPRLRAHLPEYLAEAFGLGLFMVSACGFAVLLYHPASPVPRWLPGMTSRNLLMGLAMGLTLLVNFYGPWGQRSGAHLNPVVTLTFFRLGKVHPGDVAPYIVAQFLGAVAGVAVARLLFGALVADASVNYVATLPGPAGVAVAFAAELAIAFLLMLVVLHAASSQALARYTGLLAASLVTLYIAVESSYSGMSMNPARTVGSALFAGRWTAVWIYFAAPLAGMLGAAQLYLALRGPRTRLCAKITHRPAVRCIFCEYHGR